ncbi:hypothetical protein DFO61_0809 [Ectopseudomonas oleovorans]|uniref:Uncharacterized protein n=1 Tax=Ectopseudomonas oleovorans TaxID=301 RepID=A0A397NM73_ECTOL|nr:hypothetical protein DFO61_0809 [Pseudomonas oleovorans]
MRVGINNNTSKGHHTFTENRTPTDRRGWMQHIAEVSPRSLQLKQLAVANNIVADSHDYSVVSFEHALEHCRITDDLPRTIATQLWPGIVKKIYNLPTTTLGSVSYDLAMATGPKNRKPAHCSCPVNFDIVASPLALIPSRLKTFQSVKAMILISNHSD